MASEQQNPRTNPDPKTQSSRTKQSQGLSLTPGKQATLANSRPIASNQTAENSDQLMGYLD